MEMQENEISPKSRQNKFRDSQDLKRKSRVTSQMNVLLFRHKEMLKKDILKKRALLEKELSIDIQVYFNIIKYYKKEEGVIFFKLENIFKNWNREECKRRKSDFF